VACARYAALAQSAFSDLPRKETLILENPEGTIKNAGWFNIWAISGGSQSNGLQQVAMDTFWYIDPEKGLDGVWDNSLAADKPAYNADFTEMTVKLRKGARQLRHDDLQACNTATAPQRVAPVDLKHVSIDGDRIRLTLAPASWNAVRLVPA
jgi:hypothetical protein